MYIGRVRCREHPNQHVCTTTKKKYGKKVEKKYGKKSTGKYGGKVRENVT